MGLQTCQTERKRWEKMLPVIEAFAEGEAIEFKDRYGEWMLCASPNFTGSPDNYRIKPKMEYRPYNDGELVELIGKVVHHISGAKSMITGCHGGRVMCEGRTVSAAVLLSDFCFLDGERCGVLTNKEAIQEG